MSMRSWSWTSSELVELVHVAGATGAWKGPGSNSRWGLGGGEGPGGVEGVSGGLPRELASPQVRQGAIGKGNAMFPWREGAPGTVATEIIIVNEYTMEPWPVGQEGGWHMMVASLLAQVVG